MRKMRDGDSAFLQRIPNRRAIVNCSNNEVISVVSDQYQLVTNRDALDYAYMCCEAAFPEIRGHQWVFKDARAPGSWGSCRIDLVHATADLDFSGVAARNRPDTYGPFVRVTNSYNKSRALGFDIGFMRKVCSNGMILPMSSVSFSFNHTTKRITERVQFKLARKGFQDLKKRFLSLIAPLQERKISVDHFVPVVQSALGFRRPEAMLPHRASQWESFVRKLDVISRKYAAELGENGYGLLNTVTEVASDPPRVEFVRRERHSLQTMAGSWLTSFSAECRKADFKVDEYVQELQADAPSERRSGRSSKSEAGDSRLATLAA